MSGFSSGPCVSHEDCWTNDTSVGGVLNTTMEYCENRMICYACSYVHEGGGHVCCDAYDEDCSRCGDAHVPVECSQELHDQFAMHSVDTNMEFGWVLLVAIAVLFPLLIGGTVSAYQIAEHKKMGGEPKAEAIACSVALCFLGAQPRQVLWPCHYLRNRLCPGSPLAMCIPFCMGSCYTQALAGNAAPATTAAPVTAKDARP